MQTPFWGKVKAGLIHRVQNICKGCPKQLSSRRTYPQRKCRKLLRDPWPRMGTHHLKGGGSPWLKGDSLNVRGLIRKCISLVYYNQRRNWGEYRNLDSQELEWAWLKLGKNQEGRSREIRHRELEGSNGRSSPKALMKRKYPFWR